MSDNLSLYEKNQRVRTLNAILWIVLITATALGMLNVYYTDRNSAIGLFSLAIICAPLLWMNSKGRYALSAMLLSIIALMVIVLSLILGNGVRDFGILAYPIFIMGGVLFFGRRATPYFSLAAIASLTWIVFLQMHGYIRPNISSVTFGVLVPLVILLLTASAFIWVVVGNNERSLLRVKESEAELRANYDLTLEAWAKVLEYRDRETEGHCRRLVELSTRLGEAIGLKSEEITNLQRGALVHDIGKLAIPDDILLKPGELNSAERKLLQQHPLLAKQMLSEISFLRPSIDVAYGHHERWDGLGYPEGLKGEEIPRLARVFAIVDQWDALSSDRPYRKGWKRDAIIAYFKENTGKIYDPQIVDIFLSII
jgi:HD-GYP domain-containing protein (c-di-GMP phosphodiesterase class II)